MSNYYLSRAQPRDTSKYYLSRAQTRALSSEYPVGDPTGGAAYGEKNDPVTAIIGTTLVGGYLASEGSSDAAETAARASGQASDASVAEQRRQFDIASAAQTQARDQARADLQPFLTAGTGAVNELAAGLRPGGRFAGTTPFSFNYADYKDPSLQFSLDENLRRMRQGRAAQGTYAGGGGIKEEDRYLAGLMSTDMGNAFNRALTTFNANTGERNALYNRFAGVAGTGQATGGQIALQGINTASSLGTMGANLAGNIGNAYMTNAANTGNAAMAAAGQRNSAFASGANVLGRMYGGYGRQAQNFAPVEDRSFNTLPDYNYFYD